jgi:hypothetical protein
MEKMMLVSAAGRPTVEMPTLPLAGVTGSER